MDDHLDRPRDDLTSYLLDAELDGQKLDPDHVVGTMALLLIAGIDTTWSAIGASLWHLATHPGRPGPAGRRAGAAADRAGGTAPRLRAGHHGQAGHARTCDWRGVDMKADDWILLSFPAANRDPAQFDRAGEVVIDREMNRHAAFGLGIHRCLGSHLARMELRVALQAWLARIPAFSLADPSAVTWAAGQIRGPRTLPLQIRG